MAYMIYNNIDSRDFDLYIVNEGLQKSNLIPPKKSYTVKIAGKDGEIVTEQKYEPRTIDLKFILKDKSEENKRRISSWLGKKGQNELIISYENYKIYRGTFENQIDTLNYLNGSTFEMKFILYTPIAKSRVKTITNPSVLYSSDNKYSTGLVYGLSALDYTFDNITTSTNMQFYNGSSTDGSLPVIKINGSADDIQLTHYKDSSMTDIETSLTYGQFSGELIIDCELNHCFLNSLLDNNTFDGNFIELNGRTNWRPLTNGVSPFYSDQYVFLSSDDSTVTGEYNGQVIFLKYGDYVIYKLIDTYDGITQRVDFSGEALPDIGDENWVYSIYDIADGLNYINISGTNLNITDISFDFNFIYL